MKIFSLHYWIINLKFFLIRLFHKSDPSLEITYQGINNPAPTESGYIDFDQVAKRYANTTKNLSINNFLQQDQVRDLIFMLRQIPDQKLSGKMLDIGCGSGVYSLLTQTRKSKLSNMKYEGCEINSQLVVLASKLFPDHVFFQSAAQSITQKSHAYQLVLCSGTLQYTLRTWKKALSEIARVSQKYAIIARLPLAKHNQSFFVAQHVQSAYSQEKHLFYVINRTDFEKECQHNNMRIVSRDVSSEIYYIPKINEPVLSYLYLLEIKK